MFERVNNRMTVTVAGGLLAGVALTGCSGSSEPKALNVDKSPIIGPSAESPHAGILHCKADKIDKWIPTPTNLNAAAMASQLKVPVEAVAKGKFGGATCDEAITPSQTVGTNASVEGIGQLCLVVGLGSDPSTNKPTNKILAVCAAGAKISPNA